MFTKAEMKQIDRQYFVVQKETLFHICLKSKNTEHIWDIESRSVFWGKRSLVVHHKHKETDPFHVQPGFHPRTVMEAQELIKNHDTWYLNGRKLSD